MPWPRCRTNPCSTKKLYTRCNRAMEGATSTGRWAQVGTHVESWRPVAPSGELLGMDVDAQALAIARENLAGFGERVVLKQASYDQILDVMHASSWQTVDGIVLDLGLSSMQLDATSRGFSFQSEAPLDMRFQSPHVDHGKTTLVDAMFRQSGLFRANQEVSDRFMDTLDLERERGITIAAKNCSVMWKGVRVNIIDTPGHADFGGEVERALSMVDGAVLLVDASEGPLPQTRFVLRKALEADLRIVVVINKIDRPDARTDEVLDEIFDMMIDLDATDDQLEFPLLYAVGRDGIATRNPYEPGRDLHVLIDTILEEIPGPTHDPDGPFQMLVSDLGYSDYVGRLAVGKIFNGTARSRDSLVCIGASGESRPLTVSKLQVYDGMKLREMDEVEPGDIVVLAGIEEVKIGDTICNREAPRALPRITVDEPTVSMKFTVNTSPFGGQEGTHVQSSRIYERLLKEARSNVAIQVERGEDRDSVVVKGRGEFQLAILIETMRREGYEFSVGRPEVIYRTENDGKLEPIERLLVDCEERFLGVVTEKLSLRRGKIINLVNNGKGRGESNSPCRPGH